MLVGLAPLTCEILKLKSSFFFSDFRDRVTMTVLSLWCSTQMHSPLRVGKVLLLGVQAATTDG